MRKHFRWGFFPNPKKNKLTFTDLSTKNAKRLLANLGCNDSPFTMMIGTVFQLFKVLLPNLASLTMDARYTTEELFFTQYSSSL